ncbi:MAG: hypothetical protein ABI871_00465 [Chthoniobacterales bacterium]
MSKKLVGLSLVFLVLATVLGVLNANKARRLRDAAATSEAARQEAVRQRVAREKEINATKVASVNTTSNAPDLKVANAEAEIIKSQTEKAELQAKVRANEARIAELQKRVEQSAPNASAGGPAAPEAAELHAQLRETKRQLDTAEREKALLSDKVRVAQDRSVQLEQERKSRVAGSGNPGIRGTVLAVNQAYNFVVLNLGGRQGVEANSEMLVLRGGALIGKIRVSSVEPSTAIGDIISTSLARGVQVQPGDTVIYAGSNS